jgi:hypothetical protein
MTRTLHAASISGSIKALVAAAEALVFGRIEPVAHERHSHQFAS